MMIVMSFFDQDNDIEKIKKKSYQLMATIILPTSSLVSSRLTSAPVLFSSTRTIAFTVCVPFSVSVSQFEVGKNLSKNDFKEIN